MNEKANIEYFRDKGMLPFQAEFAVNFFNEKDIDLKKEQMKIDNVGEEKDAEVKGTDMQKDVPY